MTDAKAAFEVHSVALDFGADQWQWKHLFVNRSPWDICAGDQCRMRFPISADMCVGLLADHLLTVDPDGWFDVDVIVLEVGFDSFGYLTFAFLVNGIPSRYLGRPEDATGDGRTE